MENPDNNDDFVWGEAKQTRDKEKKYYCSFFYGDEEYHIYDNVFLYDESESEQHVGKIMKLWEELSSGRKMALVRWYLRPNELPLKLRELGPSIRTKELFLAFGKGKGVTNENRLDCFDGKCKVLCTSRDARNRQPSEEDLRQADFFFYRIYNVDRMKLSNVEGIADRLGCDVVYNKAGWVSSNATKQSNERDAGSSDIYSTRFGVSQGTAAGQVAAEGIHPEFKRQNTVEAQKKAMDSAHEHIPEGLGSRRPNVVCDKGGETSVALKAKIEDETRQTYAKTPRLWKDGVVNSRPVSPCLENLSGSGEKEVNDMEGKDSLHKEQIQGFGVHGFSASRKTNLSNQSNPFLKQGPTISRQHQDGLSESEKLQYADMTLVQEAWDANLQQGLLQGKVLLVQNLNPLFTSADICTLTRSVFKGCSDARILPQCFGLSATHSGARGEALVIFETESLADLALQELEDKCLVVTASKRPVIAIKAKVPEPGKVARFPGHFPLDNFKPLTQSQNEAMIKGLHYIQPNTLEFEMAMEWRSHQDKARGCWDQLYKLQREDISAVFRKYKKSS